MVMVNAKRMVLVHAPMGSTEILVQVYLYNLGWFWVSLAIKSSKIPSVLLSIVLPRLIHQAKKMILIHSYVS